MWTNTFGYAYNPIGNCTTSCHNAATNLYTANSLNQYSTISNLCGSVPLCEVNYEYDALGRFAAVAFDSHTEPRRIECLWDDWNIIRETLVTRHSSLVTRHSQRPGAD